MKRIIALLLALAAVLPLAACTKYKPVKSTAEEAETVFTLSLDGFEYEVPYELYRTFFLNYKATVDGGDAGVWSGDNKDEYVAKIDALALGDICEIYSVLHLCRKVGIDPYSDIVEDSIADYVTVSVEGGSIDGMPIEGHGGDYDAYLERLAELNMNYSVQELLFRYAVCSELLDAYYDKDSGDGTLSYTSEDVRAFYDSADTARVITLFLGTASELDKEINTDERISKIREGMEERSHDEDALCSYLLSVSTESEELRDGMVIAKYSLDRMYYGELCDAALALGMHSVSEPVKITAGGASGCYLLYKVGKDSSHFDSCYEDIEAAYVQNVIGTALNEAREGLLLSAAKSPSLSERDYSSISIN